MDNEYNDFAIISPEKVERMAKEYALQKNNNQILKRTADLHKLKSDYKERDYCMGLILKANMCIEKLLVRHPNNENMHKCQENIKRIKVLYERFFCEHKIKANVLTLTFPLDKEVVSSLLDLVSGLLPLAKEPEIKDIINISLDTIKIAVL